MRKRDGLTISYAYDALNRQTQKTTPCVAGQSACPTTTGASCASPLACVMGYQVNTGYDLDDRPLTLLFGGGAPGLSTAYSGLGIVYTYDNAGRMLSETNTMPAASQTLTYAYDHAGNKTSITYPDSAAFTYGYDGMNRFVWGGNAGSNPATDVGVNFDTLGRVSWVGRNHVGGTAYSYDLADRVTSVQIETSAYPELWSWVYNAASQVKSKSSSNSAYDQRPPANDNEAHTYDGLNRDAAVTAVSGYDANQNLTTDPVGARNFTYDAENKLVAASGSGTSAAVSLSYDPLGRLYQEVATSGGSSTTTQFLYSGDKLVAEYNGAGVMQVRYLHGPAEDQPLIQYGGSSVDGTTAQFLYTDRQGSVVALENTAGTVQTPFTYGPYGEPASWGGTRFAYTGQIELPEARLYHYKARVYDPARGAFNQTDPIGYKNDINLYAYVHEDPFDLSDPTGLADKDNKDEAARTCAASGSSCGVVAFANNAVNSAKKIVKAALAVLPKGSIGLTVGTHAEVGMLGGAAGQAGVTASLVSAGKGSLSMVVSYTEGFHAGAQEKYPIIGASASLVDIGLSVSNARNAADIAGKSASTNGTFMIAGGAVAQTKSGIVTVSGGGGIGAGISASKYKVNTVILSDTRLTASQP